MNSCVTYINNGRIEGINNKVKVLNQVVYGNRNFFNYKIDLSQMRQNQNKKNTCRAN
ncbi:MAG TPA: transposase [Virgibacillus sp.]|nr:transposase [Virgibacillus sp.]